MEDMSLPLGKGRDFVRSKEGSKAGHKVYMQASVATVLSLADEGRGDNQTEVSERA